MDQPPEDLKTAVAAAGLRATAFTTLQVGETRFYRASA
jgi:hypothetical protein